MVPAQRAAIAQLVEHIIRNDGVGCSNHPSGTILLRAGVPHVRCVRGKLWEMRLKGKDGIAKVIYFATTGRRLVVVRAFAKKTQKTPKREIDLAEKRMKDL